MKSMAVRVILGFIGILSAVATAAADDVGVVGRKLILLDKTFIGKAKTVYVSKLDPSIHKGAGGDPALLDGTFRWFYTDTPSSVTGSFTMPSSHWITNSDAVAKFTNPQAASGIPTTTKVTVVKPGIVAKFVATAGGDTGAGNIDEAPSNAGGITTVLTINNGNDSSTHRMCTRFAIDSGSVVVHKEIAGGSGRKIIAKNGVPSTCP
jgi:hypothetical protein